MAKSSNKNATKSFVMLIVTGVVLVAVTLCWFVINNRTSVDSIDSAVNNNASTTGKLYEGVKVITDENGDETSFVKAITREELDRYESVSTETETDTIKLENMIPGAEYFYKAEFSNCSAGQKITVNFTDIVDVDDGGLDDMITVYRQFKDADDKPLYADGDGVVASNLSETQDGTFNVITREVVAGDITDESGKQDFIVYFSFKFSENAEVDEYAGKTVKIGSINAVLESVVSNETNSETDNENS